MSKLIDNAIIFAAEKHSGKTRKFGTTPYIVHPMEVAAVIASITDDEEVIAAGLLHDTVEDTHTLPGEIKEKFGERVYELVLSETEDKMSDRPPVDTWYERKKATLEGLEKAEDEGVKILWLADKLSNLRSFQRQQQKSNDTFWQKLNQKDKNMHKWYYESVLRSVKELEGTQAYSEFSYLLNSIFGG